MGTKKIGKRLYSKFARTASRYLALLVMIFWAPELYGSPQSPDYIIHKNDTIGTYNLILEQYLQKQDTTPNETLFGLAFRDNASLNCWRGYQAIYKIQNDSLFLVDIISCGELRKGHIDKPGSIEKMVTLFGDKLIDGRVFIDWFNGDISYPLTNKTLRWDGVFYTIFEEERVISIFEGRVSKIKDIENYIDDPKRIDRRDKSKVSAILFKELTKAKWENADSVDCSDQYLVTIDENGNVSKVRMSYADEEVEKYYDEDEYNYCVNKIYHTLKSLKFDILKNKGRAISEDIYLKIWIKDNGQLEDWTQ